MIERNNLVPPVKPSNEDKPIEWAGDYYMENGFMVFTEAYHIKRGHCCKNACRHCPYGFRKKQ